VKRVLALAVLAVAFAVVASPATAATYTTSCPAADTACAALAERLEAGVAAEEANGVKLDTANTSLAEISDKLDPATAPAEIAGTVALSPDDADRLDIAAWGVWFLAGLTCCLLFSQLWHRAWSFWK
jgi:hypothetical protein